ncbi:MAG: hypothetical protein IT381_10950 [Deltaproteobacteria bacterium]|nr:hypothetical protein [Deltaproteobacteria bacterium]
MIIGTSRVMMDFVDPCFIFVHSREAPTADDWMVIREYYASRGDKMKDARFLAITDGGGPSGAQRRDMREMFGQYAPATRTAIVSDAVIVRFIAAALAMFAGNLAYFESRDWERALPFLGIANSMGDEVKAHLHQLRAKNTGNFTTLARVCDHLAAEKEKKGS